MGTACQWSDGNAPADSQKLFVFLSLSRNLLAVVCRWQDSRVKMASRLIRAFRPEKVRAALAPLSAPSLVESTRTPVVKGGVSLDAISDKKPTIVKYSTHEFGILDEFKKLSGNTAVPVFCVGGFYALLIQDSVFLAHSVQEFAYEMAPVPAVTYIMYRLGQEKNIAARETIANAATMSAFLDDRPEFFDIMQNQKQLESEIVYRKHLVEVETELKKRLDYQVEIQSVSRAIEEKRIAAWVESEVLKSIAEEGDGDTFRACLSALESMAAEKATA